MSQKKKYVYDFPEQREFCSGLQYGDIVYIAKVTGYSISQTTNVVNGKRKMKDNMKIVIEKVLNLRKAMDEEIERQELNRSEA